MDHRSTRGTLAAAWLAWCACAASAQQAGSASAVEEADADERFSVHAQTTFVTQSHAGFPAAYSGANSLRSIRETKDSFSAALFLGAQLWSGGELYVDPEVIKGRGLSNVLGIAGFPNGDVARVGEGAWRFYHARLFLRQTFDLGGARETVEADANQLRTHYAASRLVLTLGNFSAADLFDDNAYSHDPRTQFLNWSLMANGAWDYPADARGFTNGVALEWIHPGWALRGALLMVPAEANMLQLDHRLSVAHGAVVEWEESHSLGGRPGKVRVLGYVNRANMGSYRAALSSGAIPPDVTATRATRSKYGVGLNVEQQFTETIGAFARAGWNDGATETWSFTEIDRTASVGVVFSGAAWRRAADALGIAFVANGVSAAHKDYFAAGGYGFMLGDGRLHYRPEAIVEAYYSLALIEKFSATLDYQRVQNPAYNADRGPVNVWSARLHYEF